MPGRADGFRANPSAAAAVARACANPQTADAIAIEKPAVIATQFGPAAAVPPWANAGTAKNNAAKVMNTYFIARNIVALLLRNRRQWVVDVILVQTPSRSQRKLLIPAAGY